MAITISSRLSFSPFVLNFILVLVVLFLSEGARGVVIPILSNLVEIQLQQSALFLAFVVADFSIGRLLASLVLGYLSDFRGWPTIRLLQLCLISAAVGNVLFMCVPAAASSGAAAAVLIFARFITGFGTGVLTTARTFITETTPAEKRAKFLGYLGVVQFGAFVLSPLLAGFSFGVSSGLFDIDQYTTGTFILLTMEAVAIVMLWWLSTRASAPMPPLPVSAEALSNAAAVQPNAADSSNPVPYRAAPLSADRAVQLNVDVNQNLSSDADPLSSLRLPLSRHATVDGGAALPAVQVQSSTDAANSPLRPMRLPSLSRVTSSSSSSSSAGFSSPGKSNQGVAIEMEFIRRISAADMRAAVSRDDKSDSESENDSSMPNEKKVEMDIRSPLTRGSRSLPHSELTTPLSPSTVRMQSRPLFSPSSRRTQDISPAAEESGGSARVEYLGPISTSSPSPSSSPVPSESPDSSAPRTMCGRMNAKLSAAWLFTRTHLSPPEIPLHVPMLFIFLNFAIRGSLGISESFATSLFYSVDSDAPSSEASYMFTIWGAIGLICFLTVQKLIEIVGELALLFLSLCSMTLGFFLLLSFDADAAESIGLFRYSMGMFFLWSLGAPIGQVLSASMLSKKMKGIKQGWLMGVFTAAGSLGRIILPLISGALDSSATGGLDGVHGFGCAVMGLTTCVVLFYRIRWPATFASS